MQNISTIVSELYRTYAPELAKINYRLDLDITDPSFKPAHPAAIKKACTIYFDFVIRASRLNHFRGKGNITLGVRAGKFYLKDSLTLLKPDDKAPFFALATTSHCDIAVRSRLGYGTTLTVA